MKAIHRIIIFDTIIFTFDTLNIMIKVIRYLSSFVLFCTNIHNQFDKVLSRLSLETCNPGYTEVKTSTFQSMFQFHRGKFNFSFLVFFFLSFFLFSSISLN